MATATAVVKQTAPGVHGVDLVATTGIPLGTGPATVNIYKSDTSGVYDWVNPLVNIPPPTPYTYTDLDVTEGQKIFYVATTVVNGVESAPSAEMSVTVPTLPPSPSLTAKAY